MDEKLIIRHSKPEDADAVVEFALRQWKVIYEGYRDRIGEELYDMFYGTVEENLAAKGEAIRKDVLDTEYCVVTEIDGRVVGFLHYRTYNNKKGQLLGVVGHNAVDTDYRGRGIGGKQYAAAYEHMKQLGCAGVKVHTGLDDGHAPARRAYEKSGFCANLPSIEYFMKF